MTTTTNTAMPALSLRAPASEAEWLEVHALRRRALFDGNVAYDESHPDDRNPDHRVLAMFVEGEFMGTLRIEFTHPVWAIIRLVAIDPDRRGFGYGAAMMQMAEGFIYEKGWRQVRLHAKADAIGFYRRCGYREVHWDEPPQDPKGINMGKHL